MQAIIEQLINQIDKDQRFLPNTKIGYKSDLKDLLQYVLETNAQISDVNKDWVKKYLQHLEETNKEKTSFNRRASTFRLFLRFLYNNKLAPTNYSLIVSSQSGFIKSKEEFETEDLRKIIEDTKLNTAQRLILLMIGKLGLSGTQITALNTIQVDFENKALNVSDTERIYLPHEIFSILRNYLLEVRQNLPGAKENLSLFLNEDGRVLSEQDIYRLIKRLSTDLKLEGRLTTRSFKKSLENKVDILAMQKEVFNMISPSQKPV